MIVLTMDIHGTMALVTNIIVPSDDSVNDGYHGTVVSVT